jgi:hypothetical protein
VGERSIHSFRLLKEQPSELNQICDFVVASLYLSFASQDKIQDKDHDPKTGAVVPIL